MLRFFPDGRFQAVSVHKYVSGNYNLTAQYQDVTEFHSHLNIIMNRDDSASCFSFNYLKSESEVIHFMVVFKEEKEMIQVSFTYNTISIYSEIVSKQIYLSLQESVKNLYLSNPLHPELSAKCILDALRDCAAQFSVVLTITKDLEKPNFKLFVQLLAKSFNNELERIALIRAVVDSTITQP